jgi:hypothetical protein
MVDETIDSLIDKQGQDWKMVDSISRLQKMKSFMRGGTNGTLYAVLTTVQCNL